MKPISLIMILILPLITVYSQQNNRPAGILVINPDTAVINIIWQKNIASLQADFQNEYAYRETQTEMLSASKEPLPDSVKRKKEKLLFDKNSGILSGVDIRHFKYYDILSFKVAQALDAELNTRAPYIAIRVTTSGRISTGTIQPLARQANADYVIYFSNIHTGPDALVQELIFNLVLYSAKGNKVIFSKTMAVGDCGAGNNLSCGHSLSCLFSECGVQSARELIKWLK
jgi:hypothetical protein